MSEVVITCTGAGYAYCNTNYPDIGDVFQLNCVPDLNESLIDIQAVDSDGYSIALSVLEFQSFTWNISAAYVYITVDFTGTTPIDPPFPVRKFAWLFAKAANRWRLK